MKRIFTKSFIFLSLIMFASCDFETLFEPQFNEPVKEFFDTYTNTAAIEEHKLSVESYNDLSARLCINSDNECTVQFYMRNPRQYELSTSVKFSSLENIDTSLVQISQKDKATIELKLPQSFLADCDEGHNISPTISLLEPMSGRSFADYTFSLYSNSIPPQVNNPTIMNDSNTTFVVAFDMPSQAELALRHKDLNTITINGKSYPLSISSDGNFVISDSAFATEEKTYAILSGKSFTYTDRSVYYTTGDPFENGDKEYTITLSDAAGLKAETLASTKITKLNSPLVTSTANKSIESSYNSETKEYMPKSLPLLSGKDYTTVKITAPTADNAGNTLDPAGLEVTYKLFNGTPKVAKLTKSGSFSGSQELNLEVGTWYLESYATKTSYEKSSVTKCYIRVVDSCIFIGENGSDDDEEADGTEDLPYASISKAIADINKRNDSGVEYTLMISGRIEGEENTDTILASGLLIQGAASAVNDKIGKFALTSPIPVKFTGINIEEISTESTSNITLSDDSTVTKAIIKDGSTLSLESNARITEAILEGSGKLTITGNLTQETAATITPAEYSSRLPVLTDNEYLSANCGKIKVKPDTDEWIVSESGLLMIKRNITITLIEQEEDIEVTRTTSGNEVTFTVTTEGCSCKWYWENLDESNPAAIAGSETSFTKDTSGLVNGVYDLYLIAEKDSVKYSYHAQVKVE